MFFLWKKEKKQRQNVILKIRIRKWWYDMSSLWSNDRQRLYLLYFLWKEYMRTNFEPQTNTITRKKSTDKSIIYWITSIVSLGCSMFNIYLELILSVATIILIILDRKNIKKRRVYRNINHIANSIFDFHYNNNIKFYCNLK